jgi:hypothetical protein
MNHYIVPDESKKYSISPKLNKMKKTICFLAAFIFICCTQAAAQQYTAVDYWKMEHDPAFTSLRQRQDAGESLSVQEQNFLTEYNAKLIEYFTRMPDNEKASYYKNRAKWSEQPGAVDKSGVQQDLDAFSGPRSMYSKYVFSNGLFGYAYGWAGVYILGLTSGGAQLGVPLLTAGASTLIPILTLKDKNVTYNSLALSRHGKAIGLFQGAALGLLFTGDEVNDGKLIIGIATLSSIGLGRLGYNLGRDRTWSQGRVALYAHYGFLMPLEGLAVDLAFNLDNARAYAATSLAFGAGGYLLADRIAQWNDFTKGDVRSTQALSAMNMLLGFGIINDMRSESDYRSGDFLIPAFGALAGTLAGHLWLKDARFTNQQGRNTIMAATGGAVIGLGIAALIGSDSSTPYYLIPYVTGMTSYAILVNRYKKNNRLVFFKDEKTTRWNVNLMPQNILLNYKISDIAIAHPEKRPVFLPAFTASVNF